jgi:hypothetical protein
VWLGGGSYRADELVQGPAVAALPRGFFVKRPARKRGEDAGPPANFQRAPARMKM